MPDAPQYWTPAFIEVFVEAMNNDPDFMKTTGSFTNIIILRCFDGPDGQDIEVTYEFEDGEIANVDVWMDDAPCMEMREELFDRDEALARGTATYDMWKKLDRGQVNIMQALASPDYTVEGNKLKILSHLGILTGMNEIAARIEKTY